MWLRGPITLKTEALAPRRGLLVGIAVLFRSLLTEDCVWPIIWLFGSSVELMVGRMLLEAASRLVTNC